MTELSVVLPARALAERLGSVRVLDCRSGPGAHARYLERHLAGAAYVDLERDLSGDRSRPERGGRHPLPTLEAWCATLGRWAIDPSTPVVLYDDKGGANAAARAWWMLRAVGHREAAVLDGGMAAAEQAGLPFDRGEPHLAAKLPYPAAAWTLATRDIDEVARLAVDPEWRLVDVRAPERYRGESEPLDPIAGHIPGAHNVPLTENLTPEGTFKRAAELREMYAARLGVDPDRAIISCGSGVTACHTLLALEHAGLHGAALYVGSWSEWCRTERARATGPRPR